MDFSPLRQPQFRRLYAASFISFFGVSASYIAIPYQLKQLTNSPLAVGMMGLFEFVPLVLFGLYGGVLADLFNRRRLIITCEVLAAVATVGLVVNARTTHPSVAVLYLCDACTVAAGAMQRPAVEALKQIFVPHDGQRAAAALGGLLGNVTNIVGPAAAGLVCASAGPVWIYGANVVTFVGSIFLFVSLANTPRPEKRERHHLALREGLLYARTRPDILGSYMIDLLAMTLAYPVIMMPFVATRFSEHAALSILYLGLPVGALVATMTSSWTKSISHYGRAVVVAATGWGIGVAIFGAAPQLWLAVTGLVIAGGADQISAIFRQALWNESIPPTVRGRMAGVEFISYAVGPTAGQFRAGAMASRFGLTASLAGGGLAAGVSTWGAGRMVKEFWNFDRTRNDHVAEVARLRSAEEM
jgi:MFS family permease